MWAAGRFPAKQLAPYIAAQVAGGVVGAGALFLIASGKSGFDVSAGFASNGFGAHSPGGYGLVAALVCETVMTMMFLFIILGATDKRAPQGLALFVGGWAIQQLWLFWVAPIAGAVVGATLYRFIGSDEK